MLILSEAVTTTPGGCDDCPEPPGGTLEFLWATLELSILPALGLLAGVFVVYMARSWLRSIGRETVAAALGSLAVVTIILSVTGIINLNRPFVVTFAVWIVGLSAVGVLRDGQSPGESLIAALGVWGVGTVLLVVLLPPPGDIATVVTSSAIALPALLLYPLGTALTIQNRPRGRRWSAVVVSAMLAAILVVTSGLVPLGGGPAALVPLGMAVIFLIGMIVAAPLFVLGSAAAETR